MRNCEDTVAAALQHCKAGTVCLAAVSGGADSTAMLAALAALRENGVVMPFHCIHVEHGIRPPEESRGDADFVRLLCGQWRVPCRIVSIAPGKIAAQARERGIGIEAAARHYRRRAWFREAGRIQADSQGPVRILTAHTADDMLETVLMRILRGAGPAGLAAMPASRGRILRPLLSLRRSDVLHYLSHKNIPWREDSTNIDIRYLRNRVRHRLIPLLNTLFPGWEASLESFAQTQSLAAAFIRDEAERRVEWETDTGAERSNTECSNALRFNAEHFFAQPAIVREEALFQGANRLLAGSRGPPREIRRANIRRFSQGGGTSGVALKGVVLKDVPSLDLGRLNLRRAGENILLSVKQDAISEYGFALLIKAPGSYNLTGIGVGNQAEQSGRFTALLPLVLRPCYKSDHIEKRGKKITPRDLQCPGLIITAADAQGPAAFIGGGGLLLCRDEAVSASPGAQPDGGKHYVTINGGIHVR